MTIAVEQALPRNLAPAASRAFPWLLGGLAVILRIAAGSHPVDDAYITFRYARNLSTGLGMVYNAGEPVFGTSTLLYTGYLAALAHLFGAGGLPNFSLVTSGLADGLAVVLLGHLGRRHRLPTGWIVLTLLLQSLAPMSIRYAGSGLETSLVTVFLLSAVSAHQRKPNPLARRPQDHPCGSLKGSP